LRAYRDGSRPSGFMQPVAAQLTDAEVIAAANYYATLGATP
jgi:cytochrome c553